MFNNEYLKSGIFSIFHDYDKISFIFFVHIFVYILQPFFAFYAFFSCFGFEKMKFHFRYAKQYTYFFGNMSLNMVQVLCLEKMSVLYTILNQFVNYNLIPNLDDVEIENRI